MEGLELLVPLAAVFVFGVLLWWWWFGGAPPDPRTPFDQIHTEFVEFDGWRVRYHRSGQGPTLVLLHGIGANLYCWRWILPLLNLKYDVIAPDLPGFGQSSKVGGASYSLDAQTERLILFLDALKVERCYLAGNSMGGNIALWFAKLAPGRALGVCVIAPATSPRLVPPGLNYWLWASGPVSLLLSRKAMRWAHSRTVSKRNLVDEDRVEETFRTYGRQSAAVRSFILATEAIRDRRLPLSLSDITPPVLILWGSQDKLVSRKVIDALESALPKAQSEVHIGGGHHLQEDEPEWVSDKMLSFFASTLD